ncbi:MAG: hypothetical protein M1818_002163 [Claussenomyces sp. TS43310]|nr:MAG: hypothetical protein M1818_002163 [Claussenomyces sp. TS43310]
MSRPNSTMGGDYSGSSIGGNSRAHLGNSIINQQTINNYSASIVDENKRLRKRCIQAFYTPIEGHSEQKDTNPSREKDTCLWVLNNPRFRDWRDKSTSTLLWVTADPGCGKSVLSRALLDEGLLASDPKNAVTCYYFFKDISDDLRSVTKALSALLQQLFSAKGTAHLIKHALPMFQANEEKIPATIEAMWAIIESIAADSECDNVVFLLDALDQCDSKGRIKLIEKLKRQETSGRCGSLGSKLKIIVTSRPYWEIEKEFESLTNDVPTIELRGEEESNSIRAEVDIVIKSRIQRLAPRFASTKTQNALLQHLLGVENRTYLWIYLVLEILGKEPRIDRQVLKDFVQNTPDTVHKAYDAILAKSSHREMARRLLHIVIGGARPLTLEEFQIALYINHDMRSHDDLELQAEKQFKITIRHLCGLFISIVDSKVFLIHQTAKEYLVAASPLSGQGLWRHSFHLAESNYVLAETCIAYLSFSGLAEGLSLGTAANRFKFLDYALRNWPGHFRSANITSSSALLGPALGLFRDPQDQLKIWYGYMRALTSGPCNTTPNSLIISSQLGLDQIIELLLQNGANVNANFEDENFYDALQAASTGGHRVVAELLLQRGANANAHGGYFGNALYAASSGGHNAVAELLLQKGAHVNAQGGSFGNALYAASIGGHYAVAKLLLQKGAHVNAQGGLFCNALHAASIGGHYAVAELLLQKGAHVNAQGGSFGTALQAASTREHYAVAELLLRNGADTSIRTMPCGTAL